MVSNVPNIVLGIYKNYQNYHPLIFSGANACTGWEQICPPPQAKTSVQVGYIAKVEKDNWKTATISDFSIHREYRKTLNM